MSANATDVMFFSTAVSYTHLALLPIYSLRCSCVWGVPRKLVAVWIRSVSYTHLLTVYDMTDKKPHENPSIGIVLCQDANRKFVEIMVRDYDKPMGVATYRTCLLYTSKDGGAD